MKWINKLFSSLFWEYKFDDTVPNGTCLVTDFYLSILLLTNYKIILQIYKTISEFINIIYQDILLEERMYHHDLQRAPNDLHP